MREKPMGLGLFLLAALWITLLFDPHWYLAAKGISVALELPVLLFGSLLIAIGLGVPTNEAWSRRWQWYAPFLMYIGVGVITVPFAQNIGYARDATQGLLLWWALIVGTAVMVDSVRRAEMLIVLYGVQFLWWALWGASTGQVIWHHSLSNFDGFGSFNVGGLAICYFLGLASPKAGLKWLMFATAGLCALGVVASFARGAFLAAVLLFAIILARSPHKGKTLLAGVGGALIMVVAASLLFDDGFFWAEIMSSFSEGTSEGTGEDRWILWSAAWRVFLERPILGAGPRNWGPLASVLFQPGELESMYANPGALYDMSLHNLYMTTLSELGAVGIGVLAWILIDFWKRNAALRTEAAQQRWRELGGRLQLRPIAFGLEGSMVAFLANAALYSMMGIHWFFTMLAINVLLHALVVRNKPPRPTRRRRGRTLAPAPQAAPTPRIT